MHNKYFLNNNYQKYSRLNKTIAIILITIAFCSCYKKQDNIHNPYYIKAHKLYEEGKYNEAISYYSKYLKVFPNSPKANYNLASIYLEQSNYIMTIFYFKKYLQIEPNSPDKPVIKKWISASEESLYKKLDKEFAGNEKKKEVVIYPKEKPDKNLEKEVKKLKSQNEQMKKFILKHKNTLLKPTDKDEESDKNSATDSPPDTIIKEISQNTESDSQTINKTENQQKTNSIQPTKKQKFPIKYTVKYGDTLYKISGKVYGTTKYYKKIWQANKYKLKTPTSIKPGDILIIPEL